MIENITFIIAMEAEAMPLIDKFGLTEEAAFSPELPMRAWKGKWQGINLALVTNGKNKDTGLDLIGSEAATLATFQAVKEFQPQLIINAGTAGAFEQKGARVGEVYLSRDRVVFHDHRVPIPGWDHQSEGHFPVWDTGQLRELGFKYGIVTTGNSLDMPEEDEKNIRLLGGEIKDMEAAAVAWVAFLHDIPVFCVKAVTDLVDSGQPTPDEFLKNLRLATNNLCDGCERIILFLAQNPDIRLK
jgi:5'-methylthioadenosine nucleosidase